MLPQHLTVYNSLLINTSKYIISVTKVIFVNEHANVTITYAIISALLSCCIIYISYHIHLSWKLQLQLSMQIKKDSGLLDVMLCHWVGV